MSAVVDVLPGKLNRLQNAYALPSGVRQGVSFLAEEISSMGELIRRYEYDKILDDEPDAITREFVSLSELAYDIEDWVDLFFLNNRANRSHSFKITSFPMRHAMANHLQGFKKRAIELKERWQRYHLIDQPVHAFGQSTDFWTPIVPVDTGSLVGLDGPIEKVTKMVMDASDEVGGLKVVSIVGMPGSGKTSLALAVYRRLQVQSNFPCRAFVSVGQNPDLGRTLADMLRQLGGRHMESDGIEQLMHKLRESLAKKRYLIVVDDLWDRELWETTIKGWFPENNGLGSRIITTTRSSFLANCFCSGFTEHVHKIDPLGDADAKKLFVSQVFGGADCPPQMEDIVTKILRRCGGLPLALLSVASVIADRPESIEEWERYGLTDLFSSSNNPSLLMLLKKKLKHSFKDLPPRLRTCLLYLSIFPEDFEVDVDRLRKLWIAEGFVREDLGRIVVDWAEDCLTELFIRNMMQPLHLDNDGKPRYCKLHPVIHDFILSKSKEQNFVTLVNSLHQHDVTASPSTIRRLSVQSSSSQDEAVVRNSSMDLSRARSITVMGQARAAPPLTDLRLVHVLDLEGCDGLVCLDGLDKLKLLRYLSLRGTDVTELPETIGELRYLQTLDLRSTKVKELPRSIVRLRHTLETLLVNGKGTTDLLIETATRMPENIQHFRRLEELGTIDLREHHASFVEALGRLEGLTVLEITWSSHQCIREGAYCKALQSTIKKLRRLESLTIHCGVGCSMEFMDSLSPPQRLKKFEVTAGRFVDVPKWITGLQFLYFLQITVCKLDSDGLRILGDLPKLKCLILGLEFIPRKAIVIEGARFNELTRLSVDCPVPWLTFRKGAMPNLTFLQLKFCSGPARTESVLSGIGNLQGLTEVVLCYNQEWCGNSSSVKTTTEAVKEEVSGHCNPIKLIINDEIVHVEKVVLAMEEAAVNNSEAEGEGEAAVIHSEAEDEGEAAVIHIEAEGEGEAEDDLQAVREVPTTISEIEEIEEDS